MNRNLIIIVAILLALGLVALGGVFLMNSTTTPPSSTLPTDQKLLYSDSSTVSVPPNMQTEEAVRTAYLRQLPPGDTTQIGKVSIVDNYALLIWTSDPMGGEALLQFDATKGSWVVLESIGGAYSVAGLHKLGVPQKTVLALLDALGVME